MGSGTDRAEQPEDPSGTRNTGGMDAGACRSTGPAASRRATYALFAVLVTATLLGNLGQTSLNAMMTSIVADFGVEVELGQWVTTIYMLMLGIAVPLSYFLWRRLGNRAYTMLLLSLFLAGALVDFAAPSLGTMVLGRVLQAGAAGLATPVMQNVAMSGFPPERRGAAMGVAGVAIGFAPNIGPTVGALFADGVGWRWFFALVSAIIAALMAITLAMVQDDASRGKDMGFDLASFAICAIGFGGLLAGCSEASTYGLASPAFWAPIATGAAFLVIFVRRQRRVENPLVHMQIFGNHQYRAGFWMMNFLFASFMGITLVLSLYVEDVLGGTAMDAGLALLLGALVALVCNPLLGSLGDRIGKGRVIRIGSVVLAAGALLALTLDTDSPLWYLALCQAVRCLGVSVLGCAIAWLLEDLPSKYIGDGTTFSILVRQASASIGTAVMVFLVTALAGIGGTMLPYRCALGFSALMSVLFMASSLVSTRD